MLGVIVRLLVALVAALAFALAARPKLRAGLIAEFYDPATLPALPADLRIHHEATAQDCAVRLVGLLPAAMARIERVHGVRFAKQPVVGVYGSFENYARANGLGNAGIAGVTRFGRILLSPTLCGEEADRLDAVLTHELSHAHFFGWRRGRTPAPPAWFTEGLAVMASDGGGAEGVSDDAARRAIRADVRVILDDRAWTDFSAIHFTKEPACVAPCDLWTYRQRLAFRQAGLFVYWLRAGNPEKFARLLRHLEQGETFDDAFMALSGAAPQTLWQAFIDGIANARVTDHLPE